MEKFEDWFCLKDRINFTIDPQINRGDGRYYFGRDDIKQRLENQLRRAFIAPGVPKMIIYGPYGSGKTQTLFYLEHYLKTHTPPSAHGVPHTLYLPIEMRSNSTAAHLHMQMLEALGKETVARWLRSLFDKAANLDEALHELTEDPNVARALKELRAAGDSSFLAWRWITGQPLKGTELGNLQLTRNLGEVGAGDLVSALVAIGNLADKIGQQLIFLLDEFEELQNVKAGDAAESLHQYVRRLADPVNATVGFIIGFMATVLDEAPAILRRGDVLSRIGASNYVEIPFLPAVADVKEFVEELLRHLTNESQVLERITTQNLATRPGIFPFTREAFEVLADYAAQDPVRALPRYIITAINECAIQAWDEEKLLIDDHIVNSVAQYVFT